METTAAPAAVARLRRRIGDTGDPPAFSDAELALLLIEHGGSEPRARLAALGELAAEAAGRTDYTLGGSSERASQAFDQLRDLLAEARADAAGADAAGAARLRAAGAGSAAVAVEWVY